MPVTVSVNGNPWVIADPKPDLMESFGHDEMLAIRFALRNRYDALASQNNPFQQDYLMFLGTILTKLSRLQPNDKV